MQPAKRDDFDEMEQAITMLQATEAHLRELSRRPWYYNLFFAQSATAVDKIAIGVAERLAELRDVAE